MLLPESIYLLASFASPLHIGTTPASMLWMFPLLASIAAIYKATKLRVLFWPKFFKETAILFVTISIFMVATAVILNIFVWYFTG